MRRSVACHLAVAVSGHPAAAVVVVAGAGVRVGARAVAAEDVAVVVEVGAVGLVAMDQSVNVREILVDFQLHSDLL